MAALEKGGNGGLDVGVGPLPAGLPLVHRHAHLHRQPVVQRHMEVMNACSVSCTPVRTTSHDYLCSVTYRC